MTISSTKNVNIPSEIPEGVDLNSVRPGSWIDVETKSRRYQIECLGGNIIRISGHPDYCPNPTPAQLHGSIDEERGVATGLIEPGMRLLFFLNGNHPVTTSRIVSVHLGRIAADGCGAA